MKKCSVCKEEKTFENFSNCKRNKDGKQVKCKDCDKVYRLSNRDKILPYLKKYYKDNKEVLTEKNKERVQKNYEEIQKYKKIWYNENKDLCIERAKKRYLENKEDIQIYKQEYFQKNKKEILRKNNNNKKIRLASDVLFFLKIKISSTIRNSLSLKKSKSSQQILGCTIEEFKNHIESQFLDWMNWDNYGNCPTNEYKCSWHLDHIIPVSYANSEEEVYLLNNWSNFQPLCGKINKEIKRDIVPEVFNLELNICTT